MVFSTLLPTFFVPTSDIIVFTNKTSDLPRTTMGSMSKLTYFSGKLPRGKKCPLQRDLNARLSVELLKRCVASGDHVCLTYLRKSN